MAIYNRPTENGNDAIEIIHTLLERNRVLVYIFFLLPQLIRIALLEWTALF